MNYRTLGNTGLMVSEIGMGCEGFSENGFGMAKSLFDLAEKHGINYFDLYASDPELRAAVGDALQGRREKFIVQSHICSVWKNDQYCRTRDLQETKAGFEEMLTLLKTDYIDVGMIHYCDALSDWQEILDNGILEYARELKKAGRHFLTRKHLPRKQLACFCGEALPVDTEPVLVKGNAVMLFNVIVHADRAEVDYRHSLGVSARIAEHSVYHLHREDGLNDNIPSAVGELLRREGAAEFSGKAQDFSGFQQPGVQVRCHECRVGGGSDYDAG